MLNLLFVLVDKILPATEKTNFSQNCNVLQATSHIISTVHLTVHPFILFMKDYIFRPDITANRETLCLLDVSKQYESKVLYTAQKH